MTEARRICGQDIRQSGFWPSDTARVEAFIARHGGTLEAAPVGNVAIMLRWQTPDGRTHDVTGVTAREALSKLQGCTDGA